MNDFATSLEPWLLQVTEQRGSPPGLILHIGAGDEAPATYASVAASRLVFVEGDAELAAGLRTQCQGRTPAAQVIEAVVAPAAGSMLWHRYNLRPFSGPWDALVLRRWYPRLQETATISVQAIGITDLIDTVAPGDARDAAANWLLVLDLPGQETPLLEALDDDVLNRFGWVVVRRWRDQQADASDPVTTRMVRADFERLPTGGPQDVALVHEVYRFDKHRALAGVLRRERDQLQRECDAAQARAAATATELDEVKRQFAQALTELHNAKAAHAASSQLELAASALAAKRAGELESLNKTLADERKATRGQVQRVSQLEAELAEAQFRLETMQHEILKAEGQLDVVKDLLLNEPTL